MQFRLIACALTFAPAFVAQPDTAESTPQMVWQGQVDATTFLYIHAKRLEVENKDGAAVENQRYRFNDPLPASREVVHLPVWRHGQVDSYRLPDNTGVGRLCSTLHRH